MQPGHNKSWEVWDCDRKIDCNMEPWKCPLQAHDFEAYQDLLRETAPGTAVERYEVISKFLSSTEEYLHKLASKVASVKLTQEASELSLIHI